MAVSAHVPAGGLAVGATALWRGADPVFSARPAGLWRRADAHLSRYRPWVSVAAAGVPGAAIAIGLGQNSLFTLAAAGAALALLEVEAALAGVCIAVLAIKPQFGILFPLALICGRHWKVFGVSALCTVAFVGVSVVVLGQDAWRAFAAFLPQFGTLAVEQGGNMMWPGMPTAFALGRSIGLSVNGAYLLHGLVAAPAVLAMAFLWAQRARFELRAASFILATLLLQPYVMFYDLAWLILPMAFLLRDGNRLPLSPLEWIVFALAWVAPAQALLSAYLHQYLNVLPIVMIALLVMLVRRHLAMTAVAPAYQP
jgi:hypothetical protein